MIADDICPDDPDGCYDDFKQAFKDCFLDPSVVDEDKLLPCFEANLSGYCHDCVCEAFADAGNPCP